MTDADLYALAERLMPLPRTVQGIAVAHTFDMLGAWVPLTRTDVPVGTVVFDWEVLPDAKNRRAYHPTLAEVPAFDGPLTYAEAIVRGREHGDVLLSTYTCHPSMANDNVSGMVVTAALMRWLASAPRRYTYRGLFAPETIGALCWLSARDTLRTIVAGYTVNNCGDERAWSFLPSRAGDTLADRAAMHVLHHQGPCTRYTFADRGSDERQFCAPGVDLPVASVMRSKHGTYPEYHTPADQLGVTVTAQGLGDTVRCYQRMIEAIEANRTYRVTVIGEPRLDKYGLYPTSGGPDETARIARDLCAYSDGTMDLLAIAEATGRAVWDLTAVADRLALAGALMIQCPGVRTR